MGRLFLFLIVFGSCSISRAQDTMVIYLNDSVFVRTITKNGQLISEQKIRTGYDSEYTKWLFDQGLMDDIFLKAFRNEISEHRKNNFYDEYGKLIRTEIISEKKPTIYIYYTPDKMINIRTNLKETCYPAGSETKIEIDIFSHTDKEICLQVLKSDSTVCVPPLGKSNATIKFRMMEGNFMDSIVVKNDSIYKREFFNLFGYNLSTDDFDTNKKKEISKTVYYYRSGDEALMNVYSRKKKDPVKRITLGNFKNIIDLSDLKKGEHIFEIVDYTNNTKKKLPVVLK